MRRSISKSISNPKSTSKKIKPVKIDEQDTNTLAAIVRLSLDLDVKACSLYAKFAKGAPGNELKKFWSAMSKEEAAHVRFWKKALLLAEKNRLPQIFDLPHKVREELQYASDKSVELLSSRELSGANVQESFLAAFRMEYYNLHKALAPLFSLMSIVAPGENPDDDYSGHLNRFVLMFGKHCGENNPEMQLMGEIIQRLWQDNRELSRQCFVDELSGLLNRRGFFNAATPLLELARRNGKNAGIVVIDIDDFKKINDSFGHQVGDGVIRTLATKLKSSVRGSDLAARYGGEEFIVFCPELEPGASFAVAEKLRLGVQGLRCSTGKVTISLGTAELMPPEKESAPEILASMIKIADECLYEAKRSGKNKAVFRAMKNLEGI